MKVFLSHSTKDKDFVQKLAAEIESANIEPWLCEIDVIPGDDFVAEIEKGLKESDLTVLVWSPDAARSAWTGEEWRSVLARQVEESRTRLLIVMLREAKLPELLRKRHFIDARSNPAAALRETIDWLKRLRDMRKFAESKAATILLDYEPADFVGREGYLEELYKALVEGRGKFLLWGEAGSGKSLLALKFAWRAQGAFDSVVFQHCGQRPAEQVGVEFAAKLGLDVKERPPEQAIQEAKAWLCQRKTLLVLDDIWNADIKNLIPGPPLPVGALSVLCTSRQRSFPWIEPSRRMEVKSFVDEEAESVFRIYLGEETTARHRDSLLSLAARVERLPIAVAVAAEMLSRQFGPLGEAARGIELVKLKNEIHDVPGLLQRAVESQPEREQGLLRAMAVCHPDGFWFPLAAEVAGLDEASAAESRDRLVTASLVRLLDSERQRFRLHALPREQLLKTAPLEDLQEKYTTALLELFEDWQPRWRQCLECLPEVVPSIQILWNEGSVYQTQQLA
jgi:hypothetical protein